MSDLLSDMQNKVSDLIAEAKEPLVARITELGAENATVIKRAADAIIQQEQRAERAEAARDEMMDEMYKRLEQADADLAERERMLRLAWQTAAYVRGLDFPEWLADLRARV